MGKHSEKVPQLYKIASKCLQEVIENGASVKQIVYNQSIHLNTKSLFALVTKTVQNYSQINDLIQKSNLLTKEPRFNVWLARILITQMFCTHNGLNGSCLPIKTILSYQTEFEKYYVNLNVESCSKVQKPRYVRVNTFALTIDEAIDCFVNEGWEFVKQRSDDYNTFIKQISSLENCQFMLDLHIRELLIFSHKTEFYNHWAYKDKSIFLQDKASCISVQLLNPSPGSVVLDMCAAPGLKTVFLAERLKNQGTVYAVEQDTKRYNTLTSYIEETGATCIKTINKDVLKVTSEECPNVEYILVDPSLDQTRLNKLAYFQQLLLKYALTQFPQAKRVVYSTCSIYSQENEDVVSRVLQQQTNFKLVSANSLLNHSFSNTLQDNVGKHLKSIQNKCVYIIPKRDLMNGFFVAVFERVNDSKWEPNENTVDTWKPETYVEECGEDVGQIVQRKMQKESREESLGTTANLEENSRKRKKDKRQTLEDSANDAHVSSKNKKKRDTDTGQPANLAADVHQQNNEDIQVSQRKKKKVKGDNGNVLENIIADSNDHKDKKKKKMIEEVSAGLEGDRVHLRPKKEEKKYKQRQIIEESVNDVRDSNKNKMKSDTDTGQPTNLAADVHQQNNEDIQVSQRKKKKVKGDNGSVLENIITDSTEHKDKKKEKMTEEVSAGLEGDRVHLSPKKEEKKCKQRQIIESVNDVRVSNKNKKKRNTDTGQPANLAAVVDEQNNEDIQVSQRKKKKVKGDNGSVLENITTDSNKDKDKKEKKITEEEGDCASSSPKKEEKKYKQRQIIEDSVNDVRVSNKNNKKRDTDTGQPATLADDVHEQNNEGIQVSQRKKKKVKGDNGSVLENIATDSNEHRDKKKEKITEEVSAGGNCVDLTPKKKKKKYKQSDSESSEVAVDIRKDKEKCKSSNQELEIDCVDNNEFSSEIEVSKKKKQKRKDKLEGSTSIPEETKNDEVHKKKKKRCKEPEQELNTDVEISQRKNRKHKKTKSMNEMEVIKEISEHTLHKKRKRDGIEDVSNRMNFKEVVEDSRKKKNKNVNEEVFVTDTELSKKSKKKDKQALLTIKMRSKNVSIQY
ncbi:hypothetical protein RI129_006797 [Pyrocoelia pectoralis]|uniref:SAM-dependent MTase RsmB/NOP-type domain-containing protein n=1 Tax=Pyrocoelia pectoralis TaxID=417401 RepID=A0AAN7ZIT6_9COLE